MVDTLPRVLPWSWCVARGGGLGDGTQQPLLGQAQHVVGGSIWDPLVGDLVGDFWEMC